jgi:hypothetical protein
MNAEVFAEWMHRQDHQVIRTASGQWAQVGPRIYQAFPFHDLIAPDDGELDQLLLDHQAIGLRYSMPWDGRQGVASYHVVYSGECYALGDLSKKARYDVRKGLRIASVEPISFSRAARDGWELRAETLERQGRSTAETREWWQRLCHSADGLAGFETWAAISEGRLVASLIAFTCDDCCSILYQQSRTEFLSMGVNNALVSVFSSEALERPGIDRIFYGLHSLDAPPSVDRFKFRMGYAAKPVRQRVVFHPWLRPLVNGAGHAMLARLVRWQPGNPTLAKAEGMVRFYLEGRRPLCAQNWPEPLSDRRTTPPRRGL